MFIKSLFLFFIKAILNQTNIYTTLYLIYIKVQFSCIFSGHFYYLFCVGLPRRYDNKSTFFLSIAYKHGYGV